MNKEELKERLNELVLISNGDPEAAHSQADSLIMSFLEELGHNDVVELFNEIDKWYA